jgi:putative SOS response-associated peptidase YedK
MPVLLDRADWSLWLGEIEGADLGDVGALLKPCDPDLLYIWPVGRAVGSVANNGRELIEPVAPLC